MVNTINVWDRFFSSGFKETSCQRETFVVILMGSLDANVAISFTLDTRQLN